MQGCWFNRLSPCAQRNPIAAQREGQIVFDPLSMAIGGATLAFVNSIGPRIVQRLIPVKFEQAQVANVALQRERMEREEERFEFQVQEGRQRLLVEHRHRLELTEWQHQLARWPMEFMPADFIRRSGDANGRALNVIVRQTDHRSVVTKGDTSDATLRLLKEALLIAEDQMLTWYSPQQNPTDRIDARNNGVLFYPDYRVHKDKSIQGILAVLSNMVATEPSILFDISIIDHHFYRVTVSHWGEAYDDAARAISLPPFIIDLSSVAADPQKSKFLLSLALSSAIASMADTFHALRAPHGLRQPALPKLMAMGTTANVPATYWKPVTHAYQSGLRHVSDRAPLLASELAADAALAAEHANHRSYAETLLNDALSYYRRANHFEGDDLAVMTRLLGSRARNAEPLRLELALEGLRGLSRSSSDKATRPNRSLDDLFRRMGPSSSSEQGHQS